jgi:small-conductance mechanosensitive channel
MHEIAEATDRLMDFRFLGNSVRELLVTLVVVLIGFALVRLFQVVVIRRLRKIFEATTTTWDDLLVVILARDVVPALYALILYLGLRDLNLKSAVREGLHSLITVAMTLLFIRMMMEVVNHSIRSYWARQGAEYTAAREKNLNGIITVVKIVVWILGFILLLDNLGIKVSAFVAGLGITGIAVALAAQAILGDLFSYFVIFFDVPFEVGHVIKVDKFLGEVEHIGLKTTRLRSPEGEQIIVSNKFLTDSRVQNFKRMDRRRVIFNVQLDQSTPAETLRAIPALIRSLFASFPDVTFERCHFREFSDTGLRIETAYLIANPDFGRSLDIQHEVNIGLQAEFLRAEISIAFPRTVFAQAGQTAPSVPVRMPPPEG